MAGAWAIFRHRPRATGCVLARGGSDWLAAGAMASTARQLLGLLWRQGAKQVEEDGGDEEAGSPSWFWRKGSWRRKREIHGPIPTLPKFFLPRDLSQLLSSSHQFLLPSQHHFCWSALKGRLFLYYCVYTQVAFICKGGGGSAPGKLQRHDRQNSHETTWA